MTSRDSWAYVTSKPLGVKMKRQHARIVAFVILATATLFANANVPTPLLDQARTLFKEERFVKAAMLYELKAREDYDLSNVAQIWKEAGICYARGGEYAKAVVALSNAFAINPRDDDALFRKAQAYLALTATNDAIQTFLAAARTTDDATRKRTYYEVLAALYRAKGDTRREEIALRNVVAVAPNDATAYYALGTFYLYQHDHTRAEPVLLHAAKRDTKDARPLIALALLYARERNADECLRVAALAEEKHPQHPQYIHLYKAILYGKLMNKRLAFAHVERAFELDAKDPAFDYERDFKNEEGFTTLWKDARFEEMVVTYFHKGTSNTSY